MQPHLFDKLFSLLSKEEMPIFFKYLKKRQHLVSNKAREVIASLEAQTRKKERNFSFDQIVHYFEIEDSYIRNIRSDLTEQLLEYFVESMMSKHPIRKQFWVLKALQERHCSRKLFKTYLNRITKQIAKEVLPGCERKKLLAELAELEYKVQTMVQDRTHQQSKKAIKKEEPDPGAAAINAFDKYYLLRRAKLMMEWKTKQKFTGASDGDIILPEKVHEILNVNLEELDPFLGKLYERVNDLILGDRGYDDLRSFLPQIVMDKSEKLHFYLFLQNFCIHKVNQGQSMFLGEYLFWIDVRIKEDLLTVNGRITHSEFKNYITCCLKLSPPQIGRALDFFDSHKDNLEHGHQDETRVLCLSFIRYTEGKYDLALQTLQNQKFKDPLLKLDRKNLEIKILFSMGDMDEMEKVFHNTKHYLYRTDDIPPERAEAHERKLFYLKKVYETPAFETEKLIAIKREFLKESNIADKRWILAMIIKKLEE